MWFTPNRMEEAAAKAGYSINEAGDTVKNPDGQPVALNVTKDGYTRFSIGPRDKRVGVRVHRFQAWFTYGDAIYGSGIVCRHKDGNPANNHRDNIIIGTQSQNMMDRDPEVRHAHAFATSRHILKHDHVAILAFYRLHGFNATLREFSISSKATLSFIINKSQTGVPVPKGERPARAIRTRP